MPNQQCCCAGGSFEVHLSAQNVNAPGVCPEVAATIQAQDLHAPLVERLLELPMDIYSGRLGGELRIRVYDQRTWWVLLSDGRSTMQQSTD